MADLASMNRYVSRFDEQKATDAATLLLRRAGGQLTRLELIKLLYFADREATKRYNRPICGGRYVSMEYGPVLSEVYDLITGNQPSEVWAARICTVERDVILREDHPPSAVSEAELNVLEAMSDEWGNQRTGEIIDYGHNLAEWTDPGGSSVLIEPLQFLKAIRKTDQEISDIAEEVREEDYFRQLFAG